MARKKKLKVGKKLIVKKKERIYTEEEKQKMRDNNMDMFISLFPDEYAKMRENGEL